MPQQEPRRGTIYIQEGSAHHRGKVISVLTGEIEYGAATRLAFWHPTPGGWGGDEPRVTREDLVPVNGERFDGRYRGHVAVTDDR